MDNFGNNNENPMCLNTSGNTIDSISDAEWLVLSEEDCSDDEINKVVLNSFARGDVIMEEQSKNNMDAITPVKDIVKGELSKKDDVMDDPNTPSEEEDFDLDDVIEEFAKEESKIAKLDDELDLLVDEFAEAECSTSIAKDIEIKLMSDSDDDMLILEDFKAELSDDE